MKKQLPVEFIFQLFSLIIAVIIIHAIYVSIIRPNATAILEEQAVQINTNPDYVPERSVYVVIRDFEQEACFILALWAMSLMGYKTMQTVQEGRVLQLDLIPINQGTSILPEDAREFSRPVQALPEIQQSFLLPRALLTALHRFRSTRNIQDVSNAVRAVCESESERLDSELAMIRYIAWAIPSIGFLGTVRGIGQALGQAHKAVQGDIAGVTQALGVAFNSTFVALLISIIVMFLLHQLQLAQERLTLDSEEYCDVRLVRHLQT
ncbi:MAG: MotA/TolQ/ExbB proton channel family protein [Gammaproteobacteria bacterium]|jgi:biopolymer transport protein ExbB/TolQ|nr:MotA/TolQ/ExbB proton channel family protein [Gammaproteobacteria bacterium]MBT4492106.1 MotA/TolQ/ExbB proton channel family protein [Gammaproteobacteria bacterium]